MSVGSSNRTPLKHYLTNASVGKVVGAGSKLEFIEEILLVDCCTGNGKPDKYSGTSSFEIFFKHLRNSKKKARGVFIEQDPDTVIELRETCRQAIFDTVDLFGPQLNNDSISILHGDYRSQLLPLLGTVKRSTAVFLLIDPNHAAGIELSDEICAVLPRFTTMLITLGCNVGGLKRSKCQRDSMRSRLERLISKLRFHDVGLLELQKDPAQWAYLLTVPKPWRMMVEQVRTSLERSHWPKGVRLSWMSGFQNNLYNLFSTNDENEET